MAPHTLPSDAYLTVDRRLLPGDDLAVAEEEVRNVIGDLSPYEVTVERSVHMWPALVDPDDPGVQALRAAHLEAFAFADSDEMYRKLETSGECHQDSALCCAVNLRLRFATRPPRRTARTIKGFSAVRRGVSLREVARRLPPDGGKAPLN